MRQRVLIGVLLILLGFGLGVYADPGWSLTGQVSATEQEAEEGYFALGSDTMLVAKPGSDLHLWLRGRLGQLVRITLVPDTSSNDD